MHPRYAAFGIAPATLLRAGFVALSLVLGRTVVDAQVATAYTFAASSTTYSAITGGTILWANALEFGSFNDEVSAAQTIPTFNFGGTNYTQIYVSANGFITFGAAPAGGNYTPISSGAGYAGAVAAFGTNLQSTNADFTLGTQQRSVRIQTVGPEVVVQWRGVRRAGVNNENFNFQIRLNTATNVIRIVYGPIAGQTSALTNQPEVGLRGPTNTFATDVKNLQVVSSETWAIPATGTTAASTMRFTTAAPAKAFTNGLTYTFTPCTGPVVGVAPGVATFCQGGSTALAASGATTYTWAPAVGLSATTGAAVTAAPASTTTYTVTGINPGCPFPGIATSTITVNPAPTVLATSGAAAICADASTTVSATGTAPVSATSNASSGAVSVNLGGASTGLVTNSLAITGNNGNIGSDNTISVSLNATTGALGQNNELDFYLIGPGNCGAMELSTDNGGSGDNYAGVVLRTPGAFTNINTLGNVGNISGTFAPEGNINTPANPASAVIGSYTLPASALAGCPVNGTWTLAVGNDGIFASTFTGWSLTIEKTVVGDFTHSITGPGTLSALTYSGNNNSVGTVTISNVPPGLQAYTIQTSAPGTGCITTSTVNVQVDIPPVVTMGPDGPTDFCVPGSVGLACNTNPNYLWSPGGATTQNITATTSGSYTVAVTSGACTVVSAPVSVSAQSLPVLSGLTASPSGICVGGASQLNAAASNTYCASTHSSGCGSGNAITLVELEELSNPSTCSAGAHGDFTAMTASLLAGNIHTLSVTMSTDPVQYAAAWIDYNADGDFHDADELLGVTANLGASGTASIVFEVPFNAASGNTRLRVIGGNNASIPASGSCNASGSASGETEDYTVYISGGSDAGITYAWSPDGLLDDATSPTPVAFGIATLPMTFTVTATTAIGCASQGTVVVMEDLTDTDEDLVTDCNDNCPLLAGQIGDYCDAMPGPSYLFGQINATCECIPVPCSETVTMEMQTDALSSQASWEILLQGSDQVVCEFKLPVDGITSPTTENCCLPVGCYRLRVIDAGGDGFVSGGFVGGYQLREAAGLQRRMIDNRNNFTDISAGQPDISALAAAYENGAFCVPIGDTKPIFSSCDKLDWVNHQFIVASEDPAVSALYDIVAPIVQPTNTGYEFWFFDPNGGYSYRRFRSHATSDGFGTGATRACHFKVNRNVPLAPGNQELNKEILYNTLLNVRVRSRVNGTNAPFGPACLFKIDPVRAACPVVKLQDNPLDPDFSCGVGRVFGGANSTANKIVANPPQFAPAVAGSNVRYQFRFRIPGEEPSIDACIIRPIQTSPTLYLNWTTGRKLKCNTQYEVDVRVSKDGGATWCVGGATNDAANCGMTVSPWGKICMVNIGTSTYCPAPSGMQEGSTALALQPQGALTMYPNPNRGDQLFISLTAVAADVRHASVDIYDMTGKRVAARTIAVQDGMVNRSVELSGDLASGLYMVNVTAGDKTFTERLVIQP